MTSFHDAARVDGKKSPFASKYRLKVKSFAKPSWKIWHRSKQLWLSQIIACERSVDCVGEGKSSLVAACARELSEIALLEAKLIQTKFNSVYLVTKKLYKYLLLRRINFFAPLTWCTCWFRGKRIFIQNRFEFHVIGSWCLQRRLQRLASGTTQFKTSRLAVWATLLHRTVRTIHKAVIGSKMLCRASRLR